MPFMLDAAMGSPPASVDSSTATLNAATLRRVARAMWPVDVENTSAAFASMDKIVHMIHLLAGHTHGPTFSPQPSFASISSRSCRDSMFARLRTYLRIIVTARVVFGGRPRYFVFALLLLWRRSFAMSTCDGL